MKATFKGVEIELTPQQIAKIKEAEKANKSAAETGFIKVLKLYGFDKITYKDRPDLTCYQHPANNWFADLIDKGTNGERVWLTGQGLKKSPCFPGGWIYWSSVELAEELARAATDLLLR